MEVLEGGDTLHLHCGVVCVARLLRVGARLLLRVARVSFVACVACDGY